MRDEHGAPSRYSVGIPQECYTPSVPTQHENKLKTTATRLFDHFGRFDLALPTLISIGTLGFAIAIKWKLRRHMWFWITMAAIVTLHVPLILFVPWTTKWVPAPLLVPFCIADLIVMLAIVSVVGKLVEDPNTPEG